MFARVAAALTFTGALALAQAPAFEVASIKPSAALRPADVAGGRIGVKVDAGRVDIGFMSLADLIQIAYEVKSYQVAGPDWMSTERFDVAAKIPEGVAADQVHAMLRTLLAERFQLAIHRENKEHSVYRLIVGKSGSRLKDAPPDSDPPPEGGSGPVRISPSADGKGATVATPRLGTMKMTMAKDGNMHMEASKVSMPAFAEMLSRFVDRPVLDGTGLTGNYQVGLDLAMADMMRIKGAPPIMLSGRMPAGPINNNAPADAASDPGSSVFAAVQALGLKLDPRKESVETIVVDHAEKTPTEN